MKKIINTSGKRKRAIARATLRPGKGVVRVNKLQLDNISDHILRLRMQEPLILAGEKSQGVNINVNVVGGGPSGQAEAWLARSRAHPRE